MKTRVLGAGLAVAAVLSCGGAPFGPADVEAPHGITGHRTQGAFFYVVPLEDGVVVVDTGDDAEGTALKDAVAGRTVLAVLITHGHVDHTAGAASLGRVRVLAGREDVELIRGTRPQESLVGRAASLRPGSAAEVPENLVPVDDGHELRIGPHVFTAVALPGHTHGSMAWKYRDVLFGGDAAMSNGGRVEPAPWIFSENPPRADQSVHLLHNVEFTTLLDGHNGRTDRADQKLPTR